MAIATVTVSTTIVVGSLAYWISREALEKASFNQLVSVRELKADQVDNFFSTIRNQVVALSANRMVIDAMKSFHDAFGSGSMSDQMEDTAVLRAFYGEEFMARAREAQAPVDNVVDLWPADPRSQQMQHLYLAANPFPVGEKYQLERSPDGSRYADMHATFHPFLRDFSKRFGFYDLFLVDAKSGYIVYSVEKEIDFATSLLDGPYRDSNIAKVFREARHSNNANFVRMVDFESYMPSYGAQASFLASPIFNGNEITGVLIVQVPLDRLNHIMTSGEVWSDVGLGETGETYVVGPDFKVRTEPRFLVSDPESFFNDIAAAGIESTTRDRMRSLGSAVGLLTVDTPGTRVALDGQAGTQIFDDYRGQAVLSAYRKLALPDVDWAIMSEMDQAEAFAEVRLLRNLTAAMLLATAIVAMGLAWWIARNLVAPLRTLRDSANRLSAGDLEVKLGIDRGDEIGELATSFEQMRRSIQDLIQRQEASIDALATPLIPFRKEILIVPMVGLVDQTRIDKLRESLIEQVHQQGSRAVIIDLTGVPDMDATIVERLNVVTGAASLLGAAVVLTGLRPEIAQQWARQEAEIHNAVSERSLERGIARALEIANTRSDNGTRE
jgi:anti-anti-sigma regulatory factor/HAMP domain-containing protein